MAGSRNRRLFEKLGIDATEADSPFATESLNEESLDPSPSVPLPTSQERFSSLMERANAGDQEAIRQLRQTLDANQQLWKEGSNLGRLVEEKLIQRVAGRSVLVAESTKRAVAEMQRELAGENPPLIVALAAQRVTASWLNLQMLELEEGNGPADRSSPEGRWRLRHLDQAHRRFLSALRMLATLRGRPLAELLTDVRTSRSEPANASEAAPEAATVPFVSGE